MSMKPKITDLLKQAQKMQNDMKKTQEELANTVVVGEAGAGLVRIHVNGKHEAKKVELDNDLLDEDIEVIEDLIAAAINNAVEKVEELSRNALSSLTKNIKLPEDFLSQDEADSN